MKIITDFGDDGEYYLKKPIPIKAKRLPFAFQVKTLEGLMSGKPNDYLVEGIKGELYPCDKTIFEESYQMIKAGGK